MVERGGSRQDDLREELERQLERARQEGALASRRVRVGSWLRLLTFFVFAGLWLTAWAMMDLRPGYASGVPLVVFPAIVAWHERHRRRADRLAIDTDLLSEKLRRMSSVRYRPVHAHRTCPDPRDPVDLGVRPGDEHEERFEIGPYVRKDLDLTNGDVNLRDLLDTTQTVFGFRRLDRHLAHPLLDPGAIRARQEAVRELLAAPELRFEAARAFHPLRERSLEFLTRFLREEPLFPNSRVLEKVFLAVAALPALTLLGASLGLFGGGIFLLAATLCGSVSLLNLKRVLALKPRLYEIETWCRAMDRFAPLLVERRETKSPFLSGIVGALEEGTRGPREGRWRHLVRQLGFLHAGDYGFASLLLNLVTLWDLHFVLRIERGLKENADRILAQGSALGEWETLASFANYAEEREDAVFPEILDGEPLVEISAGRHPYLESGEVVQNDFALGGERNLLVVTGSNMAGKSTYLKMVSLHAILAQLGAPVRAASMRLRPTRVYTVIDVEDDLVRGFSYFRVEVERVREVLSAAASDARVLGIFDELFRGTNSTERVLAGKEILRSLAETGGLFVMATHDMEYTTLAVEIPGARNVHFAEEVDEGGVRFTYEVRPGPSEIRNALRVLESCGIPAEIIRRARAGLRVDGPSGEGRSAPGGGTAEPPGSAPR